jgi:hypothetical protein
MARVDATLTARAFRPLLSGLQRLGHDPAPLLTAVGLDARAISSVGVLRAGVAGGADRGGDRADAAACVDRVLRYVLVTPDLHRIHHSVWKPETNSNYGAVFGHF